MSISKSNSFRRWMRRYGIRLSFVALLYLAWADDLTKKKLWLTTPTLPSPSDDTRFIQRNSTFLDWLMVGLSQELGFYHVTIEDIDRSDFIAASWLWLRLQSLSVVLIVAVQGRSLLISKPPNPEADIAELQNSPDHPSRRGHRRNGTPHHRLKKHVLAHRPKVHCLCVRLVTRGDKTAQGLIYISIHAALTLFSRICDCEHLKIHIVTQTHFITDATKRAWIRQGATEVREFFVPQAYKTPNGTLYKARNLCYWQEMGGVGSDCDETRSWVLSLDEEAVVLRSLVTSFANDVLQSKDESKIGFALSPAIIDVTTGSISFWTKVMEARFIAWHYALLKSQSSMSRGTLFFHGGAFFVRASVDRTVGNDWGLKSSVAEDFATGIVATEKRITFKYLNGWFIEGTSPNLCGYITHRARILRGQLYNMCYTPMSRYQKMVLCRHLVPAILVPFVHFLLLGTFFLLPKYLPAAAPQCAVMDYIVSVILAVQGTCFAFGAAYMEMTILEIIACAMLAPITVFWVAPTTDALVVLKAFQCIFKEWKSGSTTFEITAKPTQENAEMKNGKIKSWKSS